MSPINNDAILSAVGFYNIFDGIHQKYFTGSKLPLDEFMNFAAINIPYAVNGAFACEMAFKSVIDEKTAKKLKHDLFKIYNSTHFDKKYREAIENSFVSKGLTKEAFDIVLKESSNLFIRWRYFFEHTNSGCSIPENFHQFVSSCVETMVDFSGLKRKI